MERNISKSIRSTIGFKTSWIAKSITRSAKSACVRAPSRPDWNTRLEANISFNQVYLESQSMEFISIEYQRVICDESERSENDFNYVQSGYLSDFHRSTLVNWLFELGEEYKFTPETNHLCIIIMDRYMARYCKLTCGKKIPTSRLQLIACGSMLLASKLNVSFRSFSAGQIFLIRRDIQRKFQTLLIPVPTNMMKINSKESKPKYSKRSNGISIIQEQVTRIDYWRSSSSRFMKSNCRSESACRYIVENST